MIYLDALRIVSSKYTETVLHIPYLQTINLIVFNVRKLVYDRLYFIKTILFKTALHSPYHMYINAQHMEK